MEETPTNNLQKILIFILSFFLGLFLFLGSFVFLYYNESIKTEIPKEQLIILTQKKEILASTKVITYNFKTLFLEKTQKNFQTPTWILRGIWFFVMWFWLTLFLISFKKPTNRLWLFSFVFCVILLLVFVLLSKIIIFFTETWDALKNAWENTWNVFSRLFKNLFDTNFWNKIFGFQVDIYFFYFLLFLLFLILYFLFPKIKEKIKSKIPERKQKSSFTTYKK